MGDNVPRVTEETKAIIAKHYDHVPDSDEETSSGEEETDESRLWDCETVLSTLSNVSNRPGKIGKIKLIGKKKPEKDALPKVAEDAENESEDDEDTESVV